jgi:hypothetical protein
MNFATYDAIHTLLLLLLILYISRYSQITRDVKLRIPFWTLILVMTATSAWMKWDDPILRLSLLAVFDISILSIYYLNFRKRIKTRFDYIKLVWIILIFVDTLTINGMRSLILKGVNNVLVNPKLAFRLDHLFDLIIFVFTLLIVGIIYTHERKQKTITKITENGTAI